jgi:guanylate cyclase soluble subunit beta
MVAPAFRCTKVSPTSLELHYYSPRPALWPIVKGVLHACAETMYGHECTVELLESRGDGADHEVFLVTYPFQEQMRDWNKIESIAKASLYGLTNAQFYKLFPFHVLLDDSCRVLQCGSALQRLFPDTLALGAHIQDTFRLRHPHVEYGYDAMVADANTSFLLTAHSNGMELKGMIFPTDAGAYKSGARTSVHALGAAGEGAQGTQRAMLFLASPRVASLDDLQRYKLFLSDIPLVRSLNLRV